jgi:lysophospholipase L1-like esterase
VIEQKPDLVLIAFGMNDHNLLGSGGVEPAQYQKNLNEMVLQIKQQTGADVILLSSFPPNPDWKFGTHRMNLYADAVKKSAAKTGSTYADVYSVWTKALKRKDIQSLLGNNINHPNDFGHWLYFQALCAVALY